MGSLQPSDEPVLHQKWMQLQAIVPPAAGGEGSALARWAHATNDDPAVQLAGVQLAGLCIASYTVMHHTGRRNRYGAGYPLGSSYGGR